MSRSALLVLAALLLAARASAQVFPFIVPGSAIVSARARLGESHPPGTALSYVRGQPGPVMEVARSAPGGSVSCVAHQSTITDVLAGQCASPAVSWVRVLCGAPWSRDDLLVVLDASGSFGPATSQSTRVVGRAADACTAPGQLVWMYPGGMETPAQPVPPPGAAGNMLRSDGSSWVAGPLSVPNSALANPGLTLAAGSGLTGGGYAQLGGTLSVGLGVELLGLSSLSSTGLMYRGGGSAFGARSIAAGAGASVANGDGLAGNPTVSVLYGSSAGTAVQGNDPRVPQPGTTAGQQAVWMGSAWSNVSPGAAGTVWTSAGPGSQPAWQAPAAAAPNTIVYHSFVGNANGGLNLGGTCYMTAPGVLCSGFEQALGVVDRAGTARNLRCYAAGGPGAGRTATFTARINGAAAFSCSMTGAGPQSCSSAAGSTAAVSPGDRGSIAEAEPLLSSTTLPVCSFVVTN